MEDYYQIGRLTILFSLVVQLVMLSMQASALCRHKHLCFWLLCTGSVLGIFYIILTGTPYFVSVPEGIALTLFKLGTLCAFAAGIFAIFGTSILFQSYRNISDAAARTPGISA